MTNSAPNVPADGKRPWRLLRFRLASLLWLMLCVALTIGAYRWGLEDGRRDTWRNRTAVGATHIAVYYVADLAELTKTPTGINADFDPLIQDIQLNIFPNTWTEAGGNASIAAFPTNLSLVVSHDKEGHQEIAKFLEAKRAALPPGGSPFELPQAQPTPSIVSK